MRYSKDVYKVVNGVKKLWNGFDYDLQKWVVDGVVYQTTTEALQAIKVKQNV